MMDSFPALFVRVVHAVQCRLLHTETETESSYRKARQEEASMGKKLFEKTLESLAVKRTGKSNGINPFHPIRPYMASRQPLPIMMAIFLGYLWTVSHIFYL